VCALFFVVQSNCLNHCNKQVSVFLGWCVGSWRMLEKSPFFTTNSTVTGLDPRTLNREEVVLVFGRDGL
jgi:hypothetical protein